ncbi:MAG: hypothetical protein LBI09_02815, partial [Nitrososphaerota archaeon]|nr:hypothetical protein [Nitrososphaerota archaeon]
MIKDSHGDDDELSEIDPILKTKVLETQKCPNCDSTKLMRDYEHTEVGCMDCGFIINQETVDKKPKTDNNNEKTKLKRTKTNTP